MDRFRFWLSTHSRLLFWFHENKPSWSITESLSGYLYNCMLVWEELQDQGQACLACGGKLAPSVPCARIEFWMLSKFTVAFQLLSFLCLFWLWVGASHTLLPDLVSVYAADQPPYATRKMWLLSYLWCLATASSFLAPFVCSSCTLQSSCSYIICSWPGVLGMSASPSYVHN